MQIDAVMLPRFSRLTRTWARATRSSGTLNATRWLLGPLHSARVHRTTSFEQTTLSFFFLPYPHLSHIVITFYNPEKNNRFIFFPSYYRPLPFNLLRIPLTETVQYFLHKQQNKTKKTHKKKHMPVPQVLPSANKKKTMLWTRQRVLLVLYSLERCRSRGFCPIKLLRSFI